MLWTILINSPKWPGLKNFFTGVFSTIIVSIIVFMTLRLYFLSCKTVGSAEIVLTSNTINMIVHTPIRYYIVMEKISLNLQEGEEIQKLLGISNTFEYLVLFSLNQLQY